MTPIEKTTEHLKILTHIIDAIKSGTGKYPSVEEWKSQRVFYVESLSTWPSEELLFDAWGNEIQYTITVGDGSTPLFYSFGENRLDELGNGDDIQVEISSMD